MNLNGKTDRPVKKYPPLKISSLLTCMHALEDFAASVNWKKKKRNERREDSLFSFFMLLFFLFLLLVLVLSFPLLLLCFPTTKLCMFSRKLRSVMTGGNMKLYWLKWFLLAGRIISRRSSAVNLQKRDKCFAVGVRGCSFCRQLAQFWGAVYYLALRR